VLLIFEAHPVPYHAPVFRAVAQDHGVPLHVMYGSDFSITGYLDAGFSTQLSWGEALVKGYSHSFLSRAAEGGAMRFEEVRGRGLTQAADQWPAQAVLSIGYYARFDLAGLAYCVRRGLPLMFRGETNDQAHDRPWWRNLLRTLYLRRLYARCSAMLYIGERSKQHYLRYGARPEQLFFSPYCVVDEAFSAAPPVKARARAEVRKSLGIADDARVLIFSGKLTHKKGVDLIPAAVRLLPPPLRSRLHLLFLGDGPLRSQLAQDCAAEPRVPASFVGFQSQRQLASYYHAADLLCLPSRERETWGLVINEALLSGLPCIVSDRVGCQPDLIFPGETGEVFAAGEVAALSQAIERLSHYTDQPGLANRCQSLAAHYSVQNAAQGIAQAWDKIKTV
jgi:glycosyltransferase involved in cell wall biosynthesis